ncbi:MULTISPECIES: ParA family protein [unclassified Streptomyces]|uniref:ParA family protein n=1 Tax=unclassified Streptomyces TaxID=2593676 RepID=UPI00068F6538|nr:MULTISPECIES: ParA family protein [unclassified Streptomyces]
MTTTRDALLNQKGGVGKSTTTLHLGGALAAAGRRTLLVDLDPQAHLTEFLSMEQHDHKNGPTLPQAMLAHPSDRDYALSLVRKHSENLYVIPASFDLFTLPRDLHASRSNEDRLTWVLEHLDGLFDHVLVDCRPALDIDTDNVLHWATKVIVPVELDTSSIKALKLLIAQVRTLAEDTRRTPPEYRGIVINRIPKGGLTLLDRQVRDAFRALAIPVVGEVRMRDSLVRAKEKGMTIQQYDADGDAAAMYHSMAVAAGFLEAS